MKFNQQISDSELELMWIIWRMNGTAFFADIMSALEEKNYDWKPNTVLTFLSRLGEKGMLKVEKVKHKNNYIALVSEGEYTSSQTISFIDKMYSGDAKSLVSTLMKQDCLSENDFEELKQFWNGGGDIK